MGAHFIKQQLLHQLKETTREITGEYCRKPQEAEAAMFKRGC